MEIIKFQSKPNQQKRRKRVQRGAKPSVQTKKKTTRRRRNPSTRQKFGLSSCSTLYAKALTNPFDPTIEDACIPDLNDLPSFKVKNISRTSFLAGTLGVGFIATNPFSGSVNDVNLWNASTAAYAGLLVAVPPAVGVISGQMLQAPYTAAQISAAPTGVNWRTVGFGVRIRYTGTELNRGGRCVVWRAPNMTFNSNGMSVSDLLGYRTCKTVPVSRRWISVAFLPSRASDVEFGAVAPVSATTNAPLVIFCDSMVTGQGFEVEFVGHYEYIGSVTGTTRSHTDLPGMSAIRDAINHESTVEEPGEPWYHKTISWISDNGVFESSGPILGRLAEGYMKKTIGL